MRRFSRVLLTATVAFVTTTALAACATAGDVPEETTGSAPHVQETPVTEAADVFLERHGLAGLDATAVIDTLEAMPVAERPTNLMASVRPDELVLMDDVNNQTTLPLPDDMFYVSIAPYAAQTHDCFFHSLTTCLGELANADLEITIVGDDGAEIAAGTYTTNDNGFVGLWLPRDISGTITIVAGEQTVTAPIATGADDPTCVTTLQIS